MHVNSCKSDCVCNCKLAFYLGNFTFAVKIKKKKVGGGGGVGSFAETKSMLLTLQVASAAAELGGSSQL